MASGKLILVHAPSEVAVTKHALNYKWGIIVDNENLSSLRGKIIDIYNNYQNYNKISENAKVIACRDFDIRKVSQNFANAICRIGGKNNVH